MDSFYFVIDNKTVQYIAFKYLNYLRFTFTCVQIAMKALTRSYVIWLGTRQKVLSLRGIVHN